MPRFRPAASQSLKKIEKLVQAIVDKKHEKVSWDESPLRREGRLPTAGGGPRRREGSLPTAGGGPRGREGSLPTAGGGPRRREGNLPMHGGPVRREGNLRTHGGAGGRSLRP